LTLKNGNIAVFLCGAKNTCFGNEGKIQTSVSGQKSLKTRQRTSSKSTDFEGCNHLTTSQTSSAVTNAEAVVSSRFGSAVSRTPKSAIIFNGLKIFVKFIVNFTWFGYCQPNDEQDCPFTSLFQNT
jgi:hypothetical protein